MANWLKMGEALAILTKDAQPTASKLAAEAGEAAWSGSGRSGTTALAKAEELVGKSLVSRADKDNIYPLLKRLEGLQNPRKVTVETIDISTKKVWFEREGKSASHANLYLDDQPIGRFNFSGLVRREDIPFNLRLANLSLSNGRKFVVPERGLSIAEWATDGLKGGVVFDSSPKAITREARLDFRQILGLKPGTELIDQFPFQKLEGKLTNGREVFPLTRSSAYTEARRLHHVSDETWERFIDTLDGRFATSPNLPGWVRLKSGEAKFKPSADLMSKLSGERAGTKDYPFQWMGDQLTNGVVSLPKVRPEGSEWRKLPIPAVPAPFWSPYLKSLEGQYIDEILPNMTSFIERNRVVREPKLSRFQEEIKNVLARSNDRELWSGNENTAQGVKLGHGVMFKQPTKDGQTVYVLEQADRAVYLLKNQQDAERIATGQWLRTDARKAGNRFVVHAGDWQTKLEEQIRHLAEELTHSGI